MGTMTTGRGIDEEEKTRKRYLTEKEVEEIFNLNRRTLQRWRTTGEGPCYCRANRSIKYSIQDVEDFLSERKYSSTAEYRIKSAGKRDRS